MIGLLATASCSTLTKGDRKSPAHSQARQSSGEQPLAIVADSRITRETLMPSLLESAGAAILEEALLEVALEREIARTELRFTAADIEQERAIVLQTVAEESQVDIDRAAVLVDQLRRDRGLGPRRYQAQLLRNAKLRALVSASVSVSQEEVELAKRINFGEKVRVRIITVSGERDIAAIRASLLSTPPERRVSEFAMIAVARSTDSSARRGGDLGFISPEDPSLPLPIREQLRETKQFEPTDPAVFGDGFAIAMVEDRSAATTPTSDDDVRRRVLLRKQRVAMDELANRLLAGVDATVFDESLRWSWERRR
jgi:parvulin-like peptidyl-prolyl isomerase